MPPRRPRRSVSPAAGPRRGEGGAARTARLAVRRATVADARALAAIRRAAVRAAPPGLYPAAVAARWASLPPLYDRWAMTAGGETAFVAERRGRAVGFAALRGAELTAAFVRPAAARAGVGAALVARVERAARARGVRRLRVVAAAGAVPFYAALGYRGTRPARVPVPGGGAVPAVRMAKTLGPG